MFDDDHKSIEDSNQVQLFTVTVGTVIYRYTSAEIDLVAGGNTYASYPGLETTPLASSGEPQKNEVEISIDVDDDLAVYLLAYIPAVEIRILIESLERDDPDAERVHEWSGVYLIYEANYPNFKIVCVPLDTELQRDALSTSFGVGCQWTQYDASTCGLAPADFDIAATITGLDGLTVTADTILNGVSSEHYVGGQMTLEGPYGTEYAWVISQDGAFDFQIDRNSPALVVGAYISLVASCRGSFDRCKDPALFNNKVNYMGAPHANKLNPFSADVRGEF